MNQEILKYGYCFGGFDENIMAVPLYLEKPCFQCFFQKRLLRVILIYDGVNNNKHNNIRTYPARKFNEK